MTSFDIQLTKFERRLLSFYRQAGTPGVVSLVTMAAVVASVMIVMGVIYPLSDPASRAEGFWYYFGGSVGVPVFVAPIATFFFARLLVLLDRAFLAVESLSTTDSLTGSANRRGFFTLAEQNIRSLRGGKICKVGMVDLNDFKVLNDTYGHQVGDKALVYIAQELKNIIGEQGIVGRIGGDEFALWIIAEPSQMQATVAVIEHACSRLVFALDTGKEVTLSASVGIVELTTEGTFDDALARADELLYSRKESYRGQRTSILRNRVRKRITEEAHEKVSAPQSAAHWVPQRVPF